MSPRLSDGDGERRDDAEVIETSRPDTKKAEEEKYRIIVVMHIPSIDVLNPWLSLSSQDEPRSSRGRRKSRTNVHAHLRQGHLPSARHLRHREIPPRWRRLFYAPDRQRILAYMMVKSIAIFLQSRFNYSSILHQFYKISSKSKFYFQTKSKWMCLVIKRGNFERTDFNGKFGI